MSNKVKVYSALYNYDGVKRFEQINRFYFDGRNTGRVTTEQRLRDHLETLPDNVKLYLDTEGNWFKTFRDNDVESAEFQGQIKAYAQLYTIVKDVLPNCTMLEYSFPLRDYWHQDDIWRKKNLALMPLMEMLDGAAPSVYDPYKEDVFPWVSEVQSWKEANALVRMALEMHEKVYIFTFHRWHYIPISQDWGWQLIPDNHYIRQVQAAMDARFEGRKPKGFIQWSNDVANWKLLQGQDPSMDSPGASRTRMHMEAEHEQGESPEDYNNRIHGHVLKMLRNLKVKD